MSDLHIFTDGGARGNPGPAAIGAVIKTEDGNVIKGISRTIGNTTNNVAEYSAVISALDEAASVVKNSQEPIGCIRIFSDSNLLVNQINGLFKVKNTNLRDLLVKVRIMEGNLGIPVTYEHIPREKNTHADRLVNAALDGKR